MAALTHLDTHVVAWLSAGLHDRLGAAAVDAIERREVEISPIVVLELEYLHEIGRVTVAAQTILARLHEDIGLRLSAAPFGSVVGEAVRQTWTRDPFDRVIVGQALASGAALVTRDETMLEHCPSAVW